MRSAPFRSRTVAGIIALALVLLLAAGAYFRLGYVPGQRSALIDALSRDLTSRADMHRAALERWISDGLEDVTTVAQYPTAERLVEAPARASRRGPAKHLDSILTSFARTQGIARVYVLDETLQVAARSEGSGTTVRGALPVVRRALERDSAGVDLVVGGSGEAVVIFVAPIHGGAGGRSRGAVLFEEDPRDWLFPFLAAPPLSLASAEVVLVRRDGDSATYLAPLRLDPASPLTLKRPLVRTGFSALAALGGGRSFGALEDYRGRSVYASARRLSNAPWGLVVKVDQAEVLGPFDRRIRVQAAAWAAVILAVSAMAVALWWAQRKKMEASINRSLARTALALDQANDVILFLGLDGRIRHVNRRAQEFYGWPAEAMTGRNVLDLLPAQDREAGQRQLAHLVAEGNDVHEAVHLTADGTLVPVEVSSRRVPAPEGEDEIVSLVRDVRERKRAEEALRRSERDLIAAQRIGRVGSYVLDVPAGRWTSSLALDTIFGIGPDYPRTVEGWLSLVHPDDRDMMAAYLRALLANRSLFDKEYRIARADGQVRWVAGRGELVLDAGGEPVQMFGTIQDVTERRLSEEAVRHLAGQLEERVLLRTAELEAANRELEAFSYSVSHDLRAPLRAIDGFTRILHKEYGPRLDDEGRRLLDVVHGSAHRMGKLIDDLLALSKVGRREMRHSRVDMEALARAAWAELEASGDAVGVTLQLDGLARATGDEGLLRQVWANLLGNAVKFSAPKRERRVEVGSREEPRRTVFWVRDNGVGFDTAQAGKLFGVFQRLHPHTDFEGTGIGLALVQRIIQRHGGAVWAEGVPGQGATFSFSLPRKAGA